MIRLAVKKPTTIEDARSQLQTAIGVEFGTLPPYLYALYSIPPQTNPESNQLIRSVALQEMIHMCLACNILNALGGNPVIQVQQYPGPLPGDIGPNNTPLTVHLYPFSKEALAQGMAIEEPVDPPDYQVMTATLLGETGPKAVTIGEFYGALDLFLSTLPPTAWTPNRNQIVDNQFFPGQLYAVNNYADAHKAITQIVSEGEGTNEGTKKGSKEGTQYNPIDFQDQPAHYFRFGEIFHERVLTKDLANPLGYTWGPARIEVTWPPAGHIMADPGQHDFSHEPPAAQAAQAACNQTFSLMIEALQRAVEGVEGALGEGVRHMFDLRMAALHAFTVPLNNGQVAGPAFLHVPTVHGDK
ncbi:ferritin-like protein [Paraburkholderia sp. D15]|uniref:ferritin-like domain-containing protein n=1 Tax=Paraburkholderia sp. D15 TaxID=2880218 RepID=UPI00247A2474|nr:ferritin-like protein [Paraburkholderia sp. D15]WGS53294.1 ferritin-like protein [Paraburkholderia sp. D15]